MDNQSQGNPFASIIAKLQERKAQEQQQAQPTQMPQAPGQEQPQMPDETQYGQNTKVTSLLTTAIKSIDQAITESTDPNKIKILRSITALIARVLQQENAQMPQ